MNDDERIERAFANLHENGIYAQQDHACCGRCGWAEATALIDGRVEHTGFVFTCAQSYERCYFGGAGTPMPPRAWLGIGQDDDICDAWWEKDNQEARLNDPRDAAIRAMESLPGDLLRCIDPSAFVRTMLGANEAEAQR